jgi:hypothetical protein
MFLKELVDFLAEHIKKHPEDTDKDIYWMQLDLAAGTSNTTIKDSDGQLEITN